MEKAIGRKSIRERRRRDVLRDVVVRRAAGRPRELGALRRSASAAAAAAAVEESLVD